MQHARVKLIMQFKRMVYNVKNSFSPSERDFKQNVHLTSSVNAETVIEQKTQFTPSSLKRRSLSDVLGIIGSVSGEYVNITVNVYPNPDSK